MAAGVSGKSSSSRRRSSATPRVARTWSWAGVMPESRTVIPRPRSRRIASPRTCAPVASMVVTRDIRRMTTRTSVTSESSRRKVWAAAKNSGPSSRYATMCSVEQRVLLGAVLPWIEGHLFQPGAAGHRAQGEHHGDGDADRDGGDEVPDHGDGEGEHQHHRITPGGPGQRPQRASLHHADGGGQQHPGQGGERDPADQRRGGQHDRREGDGVGEGRQLRARPRRGR